VLDAVVGTAFNMVLSEITEKPTRDGEYAKKMSLPSD
jgi:hypothetical protein